MILLWHLVKKDLHRLRLPVALLILLSLGKTVWYALIGGLYRAPDVEWLNRLQQGPELLLRSLIEPLIAYLLVGWLVFEDSPVEKDAPWITRPLSGSQVFAAKIAVASLLFVLLPLALNLAWWLASGFDWPQIAVASIELFSIQAVLVAAGLTCASLTDGFPRFVLWSLVGFIGFAMVQIIFSPLAGRGFGLGLTRLIVWCISGSLIALVIAWHQFVTRRHRQSLMFAMGGILAVGTFGGLWRWDGFRMGGRAPSPATRDFESIRLTMAGPARYQTSRSRHLVDVPVQISGLPATANAVEMRAVGEWSFGGTRAWNSRVSMMSAALTRDSIRRLLGVKPAGISDSAVTFSLPFSPKMMQRIAQEPVALHADIELDIFRGAIFAELPLREGTSRISRNFTISSLLNGPVPERRAEKIAGTTPLYGVSLALTERAAEGLLPSALKTPSATYYALVNRTTGEFFLSDPVRSGPVAVTILNQARIVCWVLTFVCGPAPVHLDEMALVVVRFRNGESIKRTLDVAPVSFADGPGKN